MCNELENEGNKMDKECDQSLDVSSCCILSAFEYHQWVLNFELESTTFLFLNVVRILIKGYN